MLLGKLAIEDPTMLRLTLPTVALVLALAASSTAAEKITETDRFRLWAGCAPVAELIDGVDGDVERLGLDRGDIVTVVRSRLRRARIFDDAAHDWLFVSVVVSGLAFSVEVDFMRNVEVLVPAWNGPKGTLRLVGFTATWDSSATGTHANNPSYILSAVARHTDKFIDEYLRVNATACKK